MRNPRPPFGGTKEGTYLLHDGNLGAHAMHVARDPQEVHSRGVVQWQVLRHPVRQLRGIGRQRRCMQRVVPAAQLFYYLLFQQFLGTAKKREVNAVICCSVCDKTNQPQKSKSQTGAPVGKQKRQHFPRTAKEPSTVEGGGLANPPLPTRSCGLTSSTYRPIYPPRDARSSGRTTED